MKSEFDPELISAYLDGELTSQKDRELVEHHLTESSTDARMLDDFREMGKLLRELPKESTPPGLFDAVHTQMERETLLPKPTNQPKRSNRGSRLVQMVASASLLMLFCTVSTFYYMSKQMTGVNDGGSDLMVMSETAPKVTDFATDESFAVAAKTSSLEIDSESNSDGIVVAKSRSMRMSKAVLAKPALTEHRASKPSAPAAMAGAGGEIPPLPDILSKKSIGLINQLAISPKLNGILEPGELVRYVTSNTLEQDISVVELSVVDVEEAFGTIQVLLSSNQIVPVSQLQITTGKKTSADDQPETKDASNKNEKQAEELSVKQQLLQDGMIALYVEASQEQVLSSLVQLDGLKNIQQVHVGSVPNLEELSYEVEPLAENETTLRRFGINQETTNFVQPSSGKKGSGKPASVLSHSLVKSKKTNRRAGVAPRWRVLNGLSEFDKLPETDSLFVQNSDRDGSGKVAGVTGKSDVKPPATITLSLDKKKKNEAKPAPGDPAIRSTNIDSYQIQVRLLPNSETNNRGRHLARKENALKSGELPSEKEAVKEPTIPAIKELENQVKIAGKKQDSDSKLKKSVLKKKGAEEIPGNRLRLILIISLNEKS